MNWYMWDQYVVDVVSADPMGTLEACRKSDIEIRQILQTGVLDLRFEISAAQLPILKQELGKRGDRYQIRNRVGLHGLLRRIVLRPVLLGTCVIIVMLTIFLQGRILFVQVEGNETIPDRLILEKAASNGIYLGASRRSVRSQQMKTALIRAIPGLQWAGVNTRGCIAIISVREDEGAKQGESIHLPGHVIALRDGIIRSIVTTRGTALCVPGQSVKTGQILISGYSDLGLLLRLEQAQGEILAETRRELTVFLPTSGLQRGQITSSGENYSLILGKKRINFFNSSGILDTTCVKIYSQKYMTLPGGYILPICFVKESWYTCQTEPVQLSMDETLACDLAQQYLRSIMISGRIEHMDFVYSQDETFGRFDGIFRCQELIGIISTEEQEIQHGKND